MKQKPILIKGFLALLMACTLAACKKKSIADQVEIPPNAHTVSIEFRHVVDTSVLVYNKSFTTPFGEEFRVTLFKYYISNIALIKTDSSLLWLPQTYHLIVHEDSLSHIITLPNVPDGKYIGVQYLLGVDSIHNMTGAQEGALDPVNGMFWNWNSGYIMAKLEGLSTASQSPGNVFLYHTGGFGGPNSVLKTIRLYFNGETAQVAALHQPRIYIKANVNEWFQTPNMLLINQTSVNNDPGPVSRFIADNYADMFSYISMINLGK